MKDSRENQELHHEIFGSVLDRTDMTPYLLLRASTYDAAMKQAARMMGNRGFDTSGSGDLQESEKKRAQGYIRQVYRYCIQWMFPFLKDQLTDLISLNSENRTLYENCSGIMKDIESTLTSPGFCEIANEDPRHIFLMASSRKYPRVFHGYRGQDLFVPAEWQQASCAVLKMAHLIKSVEEDSQDINDYAQLGLFLEMHGQSLEDLYNFDWHNPQHIPANEPAKRAFAGISTFFHKLRESVTVAPGRGCMVFDSGDGVEVDIIDLKSRLKSPESMFTKLGKDVEGEAYNIRDVLAITFILKNRDDTLKLFHALQKRGAILQENTLSQSITQTLFDSPEGMAEAVRRLMISLASSEGSPREPEKEELLLNAKKFYEALSFNAARNPHSSLGHRKFQCKINFSVPIHRKTSTNSIMVPGTAAYARRDRIDKTTQQYTLALELRISDEKSWRSSEQKGDSHHDAYKFRQLLSVMNRVFKGTFHFPDQCHLQLRKDQKILFPGPLN